MQNFFRFKTASNSWLRLPVSYRGAIVIAIPAICLIATLSAWIWSRHVGIGLLKQIEHTEAVIEQSNELLISLLSAETGIRGYSITRNQKFLEPYQQTLNNIDTNQNRLRKLVEKDPKQYQRLKIIEGQIQQEINIFQKKLDLIKKQSTTTPSSEEINMIYQGKEIMDNIRGLIANFQAQQRGVVKVQRQNLLEVRETTTSIQWLAAVVSVMAYFGAVYLFNQLDRELGEHSLQLRESRTLIQGIVTNVVDGVITLTPRGRIEIFNLSAAKMFGYEPREVIGKNLGLLLSDPETTGEEKVSFLHLDSLELDRPWQTTGYRQDGTAFPIEISVSKINFDNRLIAIIRDITERQETEAKLQSRADELARLSAMLAKTNLSLEKQNQELDKFAYVASHDLKAPLRAIASLSEWIEEDLEGQLPEENQRQMQLLRGRVHRMEALINALLEYSRVGRTEARTEMVDVEALLTEVLDSLAVPPSIKVEIAPGMPKFITKRVPLLQVFANLISNAIKHHDRPDGHIKISVQDLDLFYEFAVADDGPGIAPEFHDKVFVIFQTLYPRDSKENTGIGLSIVKKIVETEGGKISLKSTEGAGATFYFTWSKQPDLKIGSRE